MIYLLVGNNPGKPGLIPHTSERRKPKGAGRGVRADAADGRTVRSRPNCPGDSVDGGSHPIDVDVSVAVERQLVVEHNLVVTTAKIREQRVRIREPALLCETRKGGRRVIGDDGKAQPLRGECRRLALQLDEVCPT